MTTFIAVITLIINFLTEARPKNLSLVKSQIIAAHFRIKKVANLTEHENSLDIRKININEDYCSKHFIENILYARSY